MLIAAAAITTSFFGNAALTDGDLGLPGWLAVGAFAVLAACVLVIAWPRRHEWVSGVGATELIRDYVELPDDESLPLHEIHRDLALHLERERFANGGQVRVVLACFRLASAALAVEVAAWIACFILQGS